MAKTHDGNLMAELDKGRGPHIAAFGQLRTQSSLEAIFQFLREYSVTFNHRGLEIAPFLGKENALRNTILDSKIVDVAFCLHASNSEFNDRQYIKIWESYEWLKQCAYVGLIIEHIGASKSGIVQSLIERLKSLSSRDQVDDWEFLEQGIRKAFDRWLKRTPDLSLGAVRHAFVSEFLMYVFGSVSASSHFWKILILELQDAIQPEGLDIMSNPLKPALDLFWETLGYQPALFEYTSLASEFQESDQLVAGVIAANAYIKSAPSAERKAVLKDIDYAYLEKIDTSGEFVLEDAYWHEVLMDRLELSFAEVFIEGSNEFSLLSQRLDSIGDVISRLDGKIQLLANDFAQGLTGREADKEIGAFCRMLLENALSCSSMPGTLFEAQESFVIRSIVDSGIVLSSEIWKKSSQILAALSELSELQSGKLPWHVLPRLFKALDSRIGKMKGRRIRERDSIELDQITQEPVLELGRIISERLIVSNYLYGRRAINEMKYWALSSLYGVKCQISNVSADDAIKSYLGLLKASRAEESKADDRLLFLEDLMDRFVDVLPSITAALNISRNTLEISNDVSRVISESLPEYTAETTHVGRVSIVHDNALTLLKVAELLILELDNPVEKLAVWWTSFLGDRLLGRAEAFYEANLVALFRVLGKHLSAVEFAITFEIIHETYNEALGVTCLEALVGSSTDVEAGMFGVLLKKASGSLVAEEQIHLESAPWKYLHAEEYGDESLDCLEESFRTFYQHLRRFEDLDSASARTLRSLAGLDDRLPLIQMSDRLLVRSLANAYPGVEQRLILNEGVKRFHMLICQYSVGAKLQKYATVVGERFSNKIVEYTPEQFAGLDLSEVIQGFSEDSSKLCTKLGALLRESSSNFFWIDASRYFFEVHAPSARYTVEHLELFFQTIVEEISIYASESEANFLAHWLVQAGAIGHLWAGSRDMAQALFDPREYSFSANREEEREQVDLLIAVLVCCTETRDSEEDLPVLLRRFLISSPLGEKPFDLLCETIENIISRSKSYIGPYQISALRAIPEAAQSAQLCIENNEQNPLCFPEFFASIELNKISIIKSLIRSNSDFFRLLSEFDREETRDNLNTRAFGALAMEAYMFNEAASKDKQGLLRAKFERLARQDLVQFSLATNFESVDISVLDRLIPIAYENLSDPSSLVDYFRSLEMLWPRIKEAAHALSNAVPQSEIYLEEVRSIKPEVGPSSKSTVASSLSVPEIANVFRQSALCSVSDIAYFRNKSSIDIFGPRNIDQREPIASDHFRTALKIGELLPSGGLASLSIATETYSATGPLWSKVAFGREANPESCVDALVKRKEEISSKAADFASGNDSKWVQPLKVEFAVYLGSLCRSFKEHGDIESAWESLLPALRRGIREYGASAILNGFYEAQRNSLAQLGPEHSFFWRLIFSQAVNVVNQVAFGLRLQMEARAAAHAYTSVRHADPRSDAALEFALEQEYTLHVLGTLLANTSPQIAWLNFTSSFVETTLAKHKGSILEVAQDWLWYESFFAARVAKSEQVAVWKWMGSLQRFIRGSSAARVLLGNAFREVSEKASEQYGAKTHDWYRFLCALTTCGLTKTNSLVSGTGIIERLLLSNSISAELPNLDWNAVSTFIDSEVSRVTEDRAPNVFKKAIVEVPEVAHRIAQARHSDGSNIGRFLIANARSNLAKPLWKAVVLGRSSLADQFVESDKSDALVVRALGLSIENDEDILKTARMSKAVVSWAAGVELNPLQTGGLLGRLGIKKKSRFNGIHSEALRTESMIANDHLALCDALGLDRNDYSWYFSFPSVANHSCLETAKGCFDFYTALRVAAEGSFGNNASFTDSLRVFSQHIKGLILGYRIYDPLNPELAYLGLNFMQFRDIDDGALYLHSKDIENTLQDCIKKEGKSLGFSQEKLEQTRAIVSNLIRTIQ